MYGSVAVAFSGGVDSAVVAKAAWLALADKAIAVTAVSPSLAESERQIAGDVASAIGICHVEVSTSEFQNAGYVANQSNRCYFCKHTLYQAMASKLSDWNASVMVNGTNSDDLGDHRPGLIAADELQVRSPLVELGFDKADVRAIAAAWQLSVADKPASPCLSSRIAYGIEVTAEKVRMIEQAEAAVRRLTSINEFRVRMEADLLARIEVSPSDLAAFVSEPTRTKLLEEFTAAGFQTVTLDLEGFRSGRMNDRLPAKDLPRVELGIPN
ncbi:UNVERIFIED_CONTAM: hypothetical protein GTU68_055040 [Idotea baltica]|nr:hypothetical protein [Idotea baltica]